MINSSFSLNVSLGRLWLQTTRVPSRIPWVGADVSLETLTERTTCSLFLTSPPKINSSLTLLELKHSSAYRFSINCAHTCTYKLAVLVHANGELNCIRKQPQRSTVVRAVHTT